MSRTPARRASGQSSGVGLAIITELRWGAALVDGLHHLQRVVVGEVGTDHDEVGIPVHDPLHDDGVEAAELHVFEGDRRTAGKGRPR